MKKKLLQLCVIGFLGIQVTTAQELIVKGAHQSQKEEFGDVKIALKTSDNKSESIISLQENQATTLNKKVLGFLPYWERSAGAHNNIRYDLLTHLACFDFLVQLDASVSTPAGWPWTTEINAAHAQGVKVVMTVVNFGGSDGADAVAWEMITNTAKQATFFANIKNIIQTYSLDGVNIDFEGMATAHRGAEFNTFMANLTNYIHTELPGKEVSVDGPAVNWGGWIMDDLVDSVDYLVIMAYDYTSGSGANSGPVAPLTHHTSWKRFIKRTVETGTYAAPTASNPEKLVLAVPYYGQQWKTDTNASESTTISHVGSTRYKNTVTEADTHGGFIWNANFEYPWYTWNDGVNWNQVWTDNEISLSKKYDLAIENNLGGIGIWALNYDGTRPELWELINTKFGETASLDDAYVKENIQVYPNPTSTVINISNTNNLTLNNMELVDVLGKSIMTVNSKLESIDVQHLSEGIYFLKIEINGGKQGVFKILKSN
ncbi:glycosyl hydrolase family 18 protein [Algibacter miyuki]|uniref:Glycosyl hydrolase family 18 protein n=1 Tax=Algibacter miyuki TaxID=1306933 RepID=A0ABV5GZ05_9FLAO|nr:glycosyl hydrolase family 18 protein [Algibacter miyuki]MDN3666934.1 glycosyl hydrolase family 18 protein [Algibacter miyuki]